MAEVLTNQAPANPISGLARALLQANRLTMAQLDPAIKKSQIEKTPLIDSLIQTGCIKPRDLAVFCSETFGYSMMDIDAFSPGSFPDKVVDAKLMHAQRIIALAKRGNKVSIAISDPTNIQALEQVKFQTELIVEPIIVQHDLLVKLLEIVRAESERVNWR